MVLQRERGFSLLIIFVLLFVVVLLGSVGIYLINPLEKLREDRDRKRISQLDELQKAVKLYLRNNPSEARLCDNCSLGQTVFAHQGVRIGASEALVINSQSVGGPGWVPIDLSLNAGIGRTPLLTLPIDPLNKDPFVYTFTPGQDGKFKITASFESKALLAKMATDGGTRVDRYEIGTDLSLVP